MTGSEIKPGNVVRLKSGGHKMTVEYVDGDGKINVCWNPVDWEGKPFSGAMLREKVWPACLKVVE
jgi:uncharacterized protein YodC (DUF2158 family)